MLKQKCWPEILSTGFNNLLVCLYSILFTLYFWAWETEQNKPPSVLTWWKAMLSVACKLLFPLNLLRSQFSVDTIQWTGFTVPVISLQLTDLINSCLRAEANMEPVIQLTIINTDDCGHKNLSGDNIIYYTSLAQLSYPYILPVILYL